MDIHEVRREGVGEGREVVSVTRLWHCSRVTSYLPPYVQIISKYHHNPVVAPFSVLAKLWEARKTLEF